MKKPLLKPCLAIFFVASVFFTSGCATLIRNRAFGDKALVYPATVTDTGVIVMAFTNVVNMEGHMPIWQQVILRPAMVVGGLIDMPISLVCDTVLLPYDIYRIRKKKKKEGNQQPMPVQTGAGGEGVAKEGPG